MSPDHPIIAGTTKVLFKVPFPTEKQAEIVFNSLRVDREPVRGGASRQFNLEGNFVSISFEAAQAKNVRVSVTTLFELLLLSMETIEKFQK